MFRKTFSLILCAALLLVTFSGCSLNFFSVESLMAPPMQSGRNGEVQAAFKKYMNDKNVLLKTPAKGEFQTPYIFFDLNGDGQQEALVFYVDNTVDASVRFSVLECINETWVISATLTGAGDGIYDVSFNDMNNDGVYEIFIGWSLFEAKTSRVVTVYSVKKGDNGVLALELLASEYYNAKSFVDFNNDGRNDLVLVFLDDSTGIQKSYMRNFSLSENGELVKYSEILINSAITSVAQIKYDTPSDTGITRLFIDCLKSDTLVFTEVIYWNNNKLSAVRAFDDAGTATLRNARVLSCDIDGDGLLEVPEPVSLSGSDANLNFTVGDASYSFSLLKWLNLVGDKSEGSVTTLFNPLDSYLFRFNWNSDFTVRYDKFRETLAFCNWSEEEAAIKDELFNISARPSDAEKPEHSDGMIFSENGVAYYYGITDYGKNQGITDDAVISSFINLK